MTNSFSWSSAKSINISSGGGVGPDGILGRGLGLSSQVNGDLAAIVAVLLDELVADFTQQILILFSAPMVKVTS